MLAFIVPEEGRGREPPGEKVAAEGERLVG
jgi:hypothetical protein